jgi:signal transduction histidine kinase
MRKMSVSEFAKTQERAAGLAKANRYLRLKLAQRKRTGNERARLLQRERDARREAEDANRLKDEFLAIVSHELRSPVNVVAGYASILLRSGECEKSELIRNAAEVIQRNAIAQARLISDLFNLSRLGIGKLTLDCQAICLNPLINEAIDTVRAEAEAKDISLEVNLPPESLFIYGDALRVQQILWNLLTNAVKFTVNGGRVTINLNQILDEARLIVEDTGEGIDPKFLPHIFDMFRQADPGASQRYGGMGIGLAVVQQLVQLHRGKVEAASAGRGLGTQFIVHLPLYRNFQESGFASASHFRRDLANVRVLLVDDSDNFREALSRLLKLEGAVVEIARSGAEALSSIEQKQFDVLLSDISMPDMDGFELLRNLRGLPNGACLPVVALTGFARPADVERAKAGGFIAHLTKPFDSGDLIDVVRGVSIPRL